jgi:hypothetical protein
VHIDALFGERGCNVIDFDLIEFQFRQLLRVAISVREGVISSPCCCGACGPGHARTRPAPPSTAFREVGRVIRTVQLPRYLSDAPPRRRVTAATNKVEAVNSFSPGIGFGNGGVITGNDPVEQERTVKFNPDVDFSPLRGDASARTATVKQPDSTPAEAHSPPQNIGQLLSPSLTSVRAVSAGPLDFFHLADPVAVCPGWRRS